MSFGEKIKNLRNETGWSQDELSKKIGTDGRQISRYENNKFLPSADVIIRLAKIFNVSIDYLLLDDAPKNPLKFKDNRLVERLQQIESMTEEDANSLIHIIDSIHVKNKFKSLATNLK